MTVDQNDSYFCNFALDVRKHSAHDTALTSRWNAEKYLRKIRVDGKDTSYFEMKFLPSVGKAVSKLSVEM